MDPFAHTLTGAALAAGGLRKITPLATAALLIGVNAPDIDILVSYGGEYMSLAHRRGWTHGVLAWVVLPILLTGLLAGWDKWVRLPRQPNARPANLTAIFWLSALAVLSHPALDWLNNYGIRLLMPFDGQWFYGDALFIIDPWVWLCLGGVCFLTWSQRRASLAAWVLFWAAATWLVMGSNLAPENSGYVWIMGMICVFSLRIFPAEPQTVEKFSWLALTLTVTYMVGNTIASKVAEQRVKTVMTSKGFDPVSDVMVGPVPANPFRGSVVAVTDTHYVMGSWDWLSNESLVLADKRIERDRDNPVINAAASHIHAQRFLTWSRYPFATIEQDGSGYVVSFGDARYAMFEGGIRGPSVSVDSNLDLRANP